MHLRKTDGWWAAHSERSILVFLNSAAEGTAAASTAACAEPESRRPVASNSSPESGSASNCRFDLQGISSDAQRHNDCRSPASGDL